jgi:uncharacterized protein YjbI with pentapeptide repeats
MPRPTQAWCDRASTEPHLLENPDKPRRRKPSDALLKHVDTAVGPLASEQVPARRQRHPRPRHPRDRAGDGRTRGEVAVAMTRHARLRHNTDEPPQQGLKSETVFARRSIRASMTTNRPSGNQAHGAPMQLSQLFGLACLGLLVGMPALAQEQPTQETCSHPKSWKPTNGELQRMLSDHRRWVEKWKAAGGQAPPEGRANLCNADLREVELSKANLSGAELTKANLSGAELTKADLSRTKLNGVDLSRTKLNGADLSGAELNKAILIGAELNKANLSQAMLNNADLFGAVLNGADLTGAKLNEAVLFRAELGKANLSFAVLNGANLSYAALNGVILRSANIAGAQLDDADLTAAEYAPRSAAPDPYVAGITGLETVTFPPVKKPVSCN